MMTGSPTEERFVKVHLQVELDFGKGLHVRWNDLHYMLLCYAMETLNGSEESRNSTCFQYGGLNSTILIGTVTIYKTADQYITLPSPFLKKDGTIFNSCTKLLGKY